MTDSNLIKKIYDMTQRSMGYVQTNVFKETLRQLVHIFGNIYFLDSNNSKTVKRVNKRSIFIEYSQ